MDTDAQEPAGAGGIHSPHPAQGFNEITPVLAEDSPSPAPGRQEAWGPVLALAFLPWGSVQGPGSHSAPQPGVPLRNQPGHAAHIH